MCILIVTGMEGARNCADAVSRSLGMEVEVADGRAAALKLLRRSQFKAVVVDETIAACYPGAEEIWASAKLAIPIPVNFALTGTARVIDAVRAALNRREQEEALARRAAVSSFEGEIKSTVAGLLLHSELALSGVDPGSPLAERLRTVADLAGNLRRQISAASSAASGR